MYQINKSYDAQWDEEMYFVSRYDDGSKGRTTDSTTDGSYTDWCIESSFNTKEEAQARAEFLSSKARTRSLLVP